MRFKAIEKLSAAWGYAALPMMRLALAMMLAISAGCYSFEHSSIAAKSSDDEFRLHAGAGAPAEHTVVSNYGWYLFNHWPLASGDTEGTEVLPFRLFHDTVNENLLHHKLTTYASIHGYDVADMAMLSSEQVLLSIPGTGLPLPIPYILTYRKIQISGVLVKHADISPLEKDAARRRAMAKEMKLLINEIPDGDKK